MSDRFPRTVGARALARRLSVARLDECLKFPKYFEIETVSACNGRCRMCPVGTGVRRGAPRVMDHDLYLRFVEEVRLHANWIEVVCLNRDGEPTLDPSLPERVRLLKEAGIRRVTLSTNGQLLTEELAQRLIAAGLDDIMISINGFTAAAYARVSAGLDRDRIYENARTLLRLRSRLGSPLTARIRMTVVDDNRSEVSAWLSHWAALAGPRDRVYALEAHTWGNQMGAAGPAQVTALRNTPCVSPFSTIAMHADGRIGLCGADFDTRVPMGDFQEQRLGEIWTGEGYRRVREQHLHGRRNEIPMCRGCTIWDRRHTEVAPVGGCKGAREKAG
jgi:radical SAM protein with 4Fe4S-binding SPASM domain